MIIKNEEIEDVHKFLIRKIKTKILKAKKTKII